MIVEHEDLTVKIIKLLKNDPRQIVKDLARKLSVNRAFPCRLS